MTSNTIVVNDFPARLFNKDYLWLFTQCEYGSMAKTILCLEEVFVDNIIMRHMTIVTVGFFAM
jgi:hypothetical protein